jgi:hypothetical protein
MNNLTITDVLSLDERTSLAEATLDPTDFVIIAQQVGDVAMGIGRGQDGRPMVVMQLVVGIPYDVFPIRPSGVLNSDGSQRADSDLQMGLPLPPTVRIVVAARMLSQQVQEHIAAEAAKRVAEQVTAPFPVLGRMGGFDVTNEPDDIA